MFKRTNIIPHLLVFLPLAVIFFLSTSGFIDSLTDSVWFLILPAYYTVILLWQMNRNAKLERKYVARAKIEEYNLRRISSVIRRDTMDWIIVAKTYLHLVKPEDKEEAAKKIEESVEVLIMVCEELRYLTNSLEYDVVKHMGLMMALEGEIRRLSMDRSIDTEFDKKGEMVILGFDTEILIFRIVQEWIRNILVYGEADSIKLILAYNATDLNLTIHDNGKWMKKKYAYDESIAMLELMTNVLAGKMKILIQSEHLTTFQVSIPYVNEISLKNIHKLKL